MRVEDLFFAVFVLFVFDVLVLTALAFVSTIRWAWNRNRVVLNVVWPNSFSVGDVVAFGDQRAVIVSIRGTQLHLRPYRWYDSLLRWARDRYHWMKWFSWQ